MNKPQQQRVGALLHYKTAEYERISSFLKNWQPTPYWGKIRYIPVTPQIVDRFIPKELQNNVISWLILYRETLPQELLILPFPETEYKSLLHDQERFSRGLLELLKYLLLPNENWYPYNGFRNLIEYLNKKQPFPHQPRILPKRFQVIRISEPFDVLLKQPQSIPSVQEGSKQEIINSFTEIVQTIQQERNETFKALLTAENEDDIHKIVEGFEALLWHKSSLFAELVFKTDLQKIIPQIVHDFENIMDEQTKQFLISAETIISFINKHSLNAFDFSMAGCGLWKAIERELNLSIICLIRRKHHIVRDECLKAIADIEVKLRAGERKVNIWERESSASNELKGIEIGRIAYLIESAKINTVEATIQAMNPALDAELLMFVLGLKTDNLSSQLKQLAQIRNGHAHIKAMSEDKYLELYKLVLEPTANSGESLLGRILRVKLTIQQNGNVI